MLKVVLHAVAIGSFKMVGIAGTLIWWCLAYEVVRADVPAAPAGARYRGGLRNSPDQRKLSTGQLKEVLQSLRAKTGWHELYFDHEGFLLCPAPNKFTGGSAAARRLLGAALNATQAFDMEAHSYSSNVVFAQLAPAVEYRSRRTGEQISAFPVQVDFADFQQLRGDEEARKAFDLGLVILHELGHAVWSLRDAEANGEPGECETYINRIRRELNLPERQAYFAKARAGTLNPSTGIRQIAELVFVRAGTKPGKQPRQEQFLLRWEAESVGKFLPVLPPGRASLTASFR